MQVLTTWQSILSPRSPSRDSSDQRRSGWQQCHHRTATVSILADMPRRNCVEQIQRVRSTGGQRDNCSSSPSRETTSDVFRPTRSPQPTGKVHSTLHEEANRHFHETMCQCRSCLKQHDRTIVAGVRSKPEDPRARPHGHLGIQSSEDALWTHGRSGFQPANRYYGRIRRNLRTRGKQGRPTKQQDTTPWLLLLQRRASDKKDYEETSTSEITKKKGLTTAKNTVPTPMTVRTAKFSMETEKNPMTERRKTRPAVRTIKRSTRRNTANLTCFNSRLNERKRSGRKPTRSLQNPLGLILPIQPAKAKCPNTQTLSAPDENRIFMKAAALPTTAKLHPITTPNRRTAPGRTTIC
jgi:hypothetical protein